MCSARRCGAGATASVALVLSCPSSLAVPAALLPSLRCEGNEQRERDACLFRPPAGRGRDHSRDCDWAATTRLTVVTRSPLWAALFPSTHTPAMRPAQWTRSTVGGDTMARDSGGEMIACARKVSKATAHSHRVLASRRGLCNLYLSPRCDHGLIIVPTHSRCARCSGAQDRAQRIRSRLTASGGSTGCLRLPPILAFVCAVHAGLIRCAGIARVAHCSRSSRPAPSITPRDHPEPTPLPCDVDSQDTPVAGINSTDTPCDPSRGRGPAPARDPSLHVRRAV